ncbi:hypothetical protein QYE76_069247 [Lolium multiflorum]|uniref:Uncharacterized protein n=1 Tax=Lolium multiflorum TaxID=4521 RepID=A0AAD8SFY4_LOLMU|nr:hypothetical protein QYE76_069247 [Lolium multiflorum]
MLLAPSPRAAPTAPPPKISKLIKGRRRPPTPPLRQPLVLHVSKAARDTATKATGLLGRITSSARGRDQGISCPMPKWNARYDSATRGLGKDRLPAPVGDRSHARKALFEELLWEHRDLAEVHDKCQVIPEASIEALKEQLAAAQREKDQLIRRHRGAERPKTSYQELKSQLIQLGLDPQSC